MPLTTTHNNFIVEVIVPSAPPVPTVDGGGSSTLRFPAAYDLGGHRMVILGASGLEYADATNHDHIGRVLGMTTGAVTAGSVVSLQSIAEMVEPLWNWDISKLVYLRENGLLTQTPPAAPDYAFCMVIGFPKSPTSLILNPGNAIILN